MSNILQIILGSSIVTTLATSLINYFFHKKTERESTELKAKFENLSRIQTTDFEWKKQTAEILGQIYIYLNRTRLAFERKYSNLKKYDQYFEDEIMFTSNKYIRDLILENGHHISPELLDEASKLVEHYDAWLIKYNQVRKINNDTNAIHIYVGPDGFHFPEEAEQKFKKSYEELFKSIMQYNNAAANALL